MYSVQQDCIIWLILLQSVQTYSNYEGETPLQRMEQNCGQLKFKYSKWSN